MFKRKTSPDEKDIRINAVKLRMFFQLRLALQHIAHSKL